MDGEGRQLINWVAEVTSETQERNDWNKPGRLEDFYPLYQDWTFDWLDVAAMIRNSERIFEYPMVDQDPVERWTFGRSPRWPAMPPTRCIPAARMEGFARR